MLAIIGASRLVQALPHLLLALRRLEEQDVSAGRSISLHALQGAVHALACAGVGAGDDQEVLLVRPGLGGDLDFLDHVLHRNHTLEGRVAALLGEFLIFKLDGR
jgi:hypothetical protein